MRKLFTMFVIMLMLFIGCQSAPEIKPGPGDFNSHESVSIMPDESIMISGNVYENTYREFLRLTMTGKKHYTVRLHTNGGDAFSTVAIVHRMKELQAQGVTFTTIVGGKAFSAGSYIFMMGDRRIMYGGTNLMWHTVKGQFKIKGRAWPTDRGVVISNMDNFVVETFSQRFPDIDKKHIYEWFWNTDMTYMSATEALLWGIATEVIY